jgi:error-prone DNA polymerase
VSRGSYTHLHVRSGFSYGYGTAEPEELITGATEAGYGTLALTDRDGLYGIPRFLKAAEETGVAPVVGAEITFEHESVRGHLVLLVESQAGYRSLCRLISGYRLAGSSGGLKGTSARERRNPSCSLETLGHYAEGLVCLTGAIPYGLLPALLGIGSRGKPTAAARELLSTLSEAFEGRLYVELTDDCTAGSRRNLRRVAEFARKGGVPTTATNEVAYLVREDHRLHDVLHAASNLTALPGPEYRPTDQLWLKPPERMERLFSDYPEALGKTRELAERCAGAVSLSGRVHVPAANLRSGASAREKLLALVLRGARSRYGNADGKALPENVRSRLRRELSCIGSLGFTRYFLLAHEAAEIARERGIPVTGRGSAANSLICHVLGLTQPDPFKHRLLFERFMHEGREDAPDIDLDFCSRRRDEVRDELVWRYRGRGAAVAATAGTFSLRGAVREVARALGHSPSQIDELARHVPRDIRDRDASINERESSIWEHALREPAMRGHPLQDRSRYGLLLELSEKLNGRLHQPGTHLGGLVVGTPKNELRDLVPLEPAGKEGLVRCQYDKDGLEYCGIPKLDLLGLRMHTALSEAGRLASIRAGREIDPYSVPADDRETFSLIRTGHNAGMFQLESPGQMALSRRLQPRRSQHLIAQISLFRPGPVQGDLVTPYVERRHGREAYSVPLPELEEILRPTYGVLVYQEQVLEVAGAMGFTLAEGDQIRRAMTERSGREAMVGIRREFLDRVRNCGVAQETAGTVWRWLEGFASYGFSAAHAASFAEISYSSAYMRTHYPAEFFAGIMNAQPMGFYSPRTVLNEARRAGLRIQPPDIRLSGEGFTVEHEGNYRATLRVGLSYCKGLSRRALKEILTERVERSFKDVADLYRRTCVERDALAMLAKGGFLDGLAGDGPGARARLLDEVRALPPKRRRRGGQDELPLPHPAASWESRERPTTDYLPLSPGARERMELEALSLNVSWHPLSAYREALRELGVMPSRQMLELPHGTRARAAGLLEILQRPPTRSGRRVYFPLVEDEHGLLQATVFESVYARYGHLLHRCPALLLEGRVEQDPRRGFSFLVEKVADLRQVLGKRGGVDSYTHRPFARPVTDLSISPVGAGSEGPLSAGSSASYPAR